MHCEGKSKLRSHYTSYCLIDVVTKAGLTVFYYLSASKIWPVMGVAFGGTGLIKSGTTVFILYYQ